MMKVVLKLDLHDDKYKKKAMRTVSSLAGVDSISMDMKGQKLTVTGDIDAVHIVGKLRKLCSTEILTVGPAKEDKKKEEPKKEDPKKQEDQKKNENTPPVFWPPYYPPYYSHPHPNYYVRTVEEEPINNCVIS